MCVYKMVQGLLLLILLSVSVCGHAALSEEELAQLGTTLTPLGAEMAGNADGTIPAWTGGMTEPPTNHFRPGIYYGNPYADDRPLFTITGKNADQYKTHLSEGQFALLRRYPTYKMVVYPSRRSASFPKRYYEETRIAAANAVLANHGNGVQNVTGGLPFPIPKDGREAIWNHILRYRGETYQTIWSSAAVQRDGSFTPSRIEFEIRTSYGNPALSEKARTPNRIIDFLEVFHSPPRLAGTVLLVYEPLDQVKERRTSWLYLPGQRRVRLAPEVGYDNPNMSSDGMATNDDFDMYNGAIDRYDWKLLGKREVYIPYNAYDLISPKLKHTDIIKPNHINHDHARYELHRVWVVEATVKPGHSHIYAKRVFYLDEDSWAVVWTDRYDARGQLWRVGEAHSVNLYDKPQFFMVTEAHYDLQLGRYYVKALYNEEPWIVRPIKRTAADFTPARLRDFGVR